MLVTASVPTATKAGTVILAGGAKGAVEGAAVIECGLTVWEIASALADLPARLPADDTAKAEKAIMGTITHKLTYSNDKLSLGGMCKGAGLGPDGNFKRDGSVAYYLAEEVVADEQKGTGVSMMAYSEYLLAQKLGTLDPAYPAVELFKRDYDPILPTDPGFKDHM